MKDLSRIEVDFSPDDHSLDKRWLGVIVVAVFLFYLPFVSRQFIGDDWLWLAYAKKAISSPLIFLERPMYGYFRPLNMVLVFLQRLAFGDNAVTFSLVCILLHCANAWLLWRVLKRLQVPAMMQFAATVFFGFYFLNAPAIEWISVAHDLWVTCLCLLVVLKSLDVVDRPSISNFSQIWLLTMAATLIKESGFVAAGVFWAVLLLKGKSPLSRPYRTFTVLAGLSYVGYLAGYAATRTVTDPAVTFGVGTFTNLWYYLVYLVTPFTKRIVAMLPNQAVSILGLAKIAVTVLAPLCWAYLWWKGGAACRLFLGWSAAFVATFAIMSRDLSLFDPYIDHSISRFTYSPTVGLSVCIGWLTSKVAERVRVVRVKPVVLVATVLFVCSNWIVVWQVSKVSAESQAAANRVVEAFRSSTGQLETSDKVIVYSDEPPSRASLVTSSWHLEAIIYIVIDRILPVTFIQSEPPITGNLSGEAAFRWNSSTQSFVAWNP